MTESDLKQYRSLMHNIRDLTSRITDEKSRELDSVKGKVKGSMDKHPYIQVSYTTDMYNPDQVKASVDRIKKWELDMETCKQRVIEIEQYIDRIHDPELQLIFRYRFVDGLKQSEIASRLNLDRSRISRKISKEIEKRTQSTKQVC